MKNMMDWANANTIMQWNRLSEMKFAGVIVYMCDNLCDNNGQFLPTLEYKMEFKMEFKKDLNRLYFLIKESTIFLIPA